MGGGERDLAAAFTYAWWLTGDDDAEAAVRAVAQTGGDLELGPLPVRVRAGAVRGTTMCPPPPAAAPVEIPPRRTPPERPIPPPRRRPGAAVWAGVAALLPGIALLVVALGEPGDTGARAALEPTSASRRAAGPTAQPSPHPVARTPEPAQSNPELQDGPNPARDTPQPAGRSHDPMAMTAPDVSAGRGGFVVTGAGLLPGGSPSPVPDGAVVSRDEPLPIAVDYRGATDGVVLTGDWRLDGRRFRRLRVLLTGRESRHVFGTTVPPGGWPEGRHRIALRTLGETATTVTFTVGAPEPKDRPEPP